MKQAIKTILTRLPGGISFLEKLRFKDSEDLFTYYYDRNIWGDQEAHRASSAAAFRRSRRNQQWKTTGVSSRAGCGMS